MRIFKIQHFRIHHRRLSFLKQNTKQMADALLRKARNNTPRGLRCRHVWAGSVPAVGGVRPRSARSDVKSARAVGSRDGSCTRAFQWML